MFLFTFPLAISVCSLNVFYVFSGSNVKARCALLFYLLEVFNEQINDDDDDDDDDDVLETHTIIG